MRAINKLAISPPPPGSVPYSGQHYSLPSTQSSESMSQNPEPSDIENASEESKEMTLEVTIPENSTPGETITVQCPDSNYVQFVTPQHVIPGDTVHVTVSDTTRSDASGSADSKEGEPKSYGGVAAVTTVRPTNFN